MLPLSHTFGEIKSLFSLPWWPKAEYRDSRTSPHSARSPSWKQKCRKAWLKWGNIRTTLEGSLQASIFCQRRTRISGCSSVRMGLWTFLQPAFEDWSTLTTICLDSLRRRTLILATNLRKAYPQHYLRCWDRLLGTCIQSHSWRLLARWAFHPMRHLDGTLRQLKHLNSCCSIWKI